MSLEKSRKDFDLYKRPKSVKFEKKTLYKDKFHANEIPDHVRKPLYK